MSTPQDVPLTVVAGIQNATNAAIVVIGSNHLTLNGIFNNTYWFLVVDRSNLNVVVNVNQTDNTNVPVEVQKFANNPNYLLICVTSGLLTTNLPQGALYEFLLQNGARVQLKRIEQIYKTLGCGTWGSTRYAVVDILGTPGDGFETLEGGTADNAVMTLRLMPIPNPNGGVLYTPLPIS